MFFVVAFLWLVAASFGFLLAILSPAWVQTKATLFNRTFNARLGIFYICEHLEGNATFETTRCVSMNHYKALDDGSNLRSNLGLSCAAIAIGCAGLSVFAIWCSGLFLHLRRKTKHTQLILGLLSLFIFFIFLTSIAVWLLVIGATTTAVGSIANSMFGWPMWLAVGSSGGYLLSFVTMLISLCAVQCGRRKKGRKDLYRQQNHF